MHFLKFSVPVTTKPLIERFLYCVYSNLQAGQTGSDWYWKKESAVLNTMTPLKHTAIRTRNTLHTHIAIIMIIIIIIIL